MKKTIILMGFAISFLGATTSTRCLANDEQIPEVEIKNISPDKSKYATVLYAQANRAMFSTDDRDLKVKEIRLSKTFGPVNTDSIVIESAKLPREGFGGSFNYVIVIFHDQSEFAWTNADGTEVKYLADAPKVSPSNTFQTYTKAFARAQIPQLSSRSAKTGRVILFLPN